MRPEAGFQRHRARRHIQKEEEKEQTQQKNKGGRGGREVLCKWVESHEPKMNTSMMSQSAWLTDKASEKKKKKAAKGVELSEAVAASLKTRNVELGGSEGALPAPAQREEVQLEPAVK